MRAWKIGQICIALWVLLGAIETSAEPLTIIHGGTVIDGVSDRPRGPSSIFIRQDKVVEIRSGFVTEAGAEIVDLSDKTVLPGLIDCHTHLTANDNHYTSPLPTQKYGTMDLALFAADHARLMLLSGFTTVRDVGGPGELDLALKQAIDRGAIPGPRMWVALQPIGPTAGHSDPANEHGDVTDPDRPYSVADGKDAIVAMVRDHKRRGATVIKIMPSGGVGSAGDNPTEQLMTDEEIRAAVRTAHSLGLKVAAHAHSKKAIDATIQAGVDSIEHGSFADEGSFALYRRYGAYLVPTMLTNADLLKIATDHPQRYSAATIAKIRQVSPQNIRMVAAAHRAGVKIAYGTDVSGTIGFDEDGQEFALLVNAGLTPMEAIKTATTNAAHLLGAVGSVGSIEPGSYADIIAVGGDPLRDVHTLEKVSFVMKGGAIVKGGPQ